MKKLSLLLGGMILSGAVLAQKTTADVPMSLEGQFGYNSSTLSFTAPSIRFRYFLTDNIAARLTLGVNSESTKDFAYKVPGDFTSATGEYTSRTTNWNAAIGGEYHFAGTARLSPYAGLDIVFGGSSTVGEGTDVTLTNAYAEGESYTRKDPSSTFGVGLLFGTDYYFAENFYFGLELGMAWTTITQKAGSYEVVDSTGTISGDYNPESKDNQFLTGSMPTALAPTGNIRLGWRF